MIHFFILLDDVTKVQERYFTSLSNYVLHFYFSNTCIYLQTFIVFFLFLFLSTYILYISFFSCLLFSICLFFRIQKKISYKCKKNNLLFIKKFFLFVQMFIIVTFLKKNRLLFSDIKKKISYGSDLIRHKKN